MRQFSSCLVLTKYILTNIGCPVLNDDLYRINTDGHRPLAENVRFGLIPQMACPVSRAAAEDNRVCHPISQEGTGVITNSQIIGAAGDNRIGGSTTVKGAKVVP